MTSLNLDIDIRTSRGIGKRITIMTWKELQEKISRIPENQLDNGVKAWGESLGLTDVCLDCADEDMFYNPDWGDEGCGRKSDIDPEELEECTKVCDKGYFYLWVE